MKGWLDYMFSKVAADKAQAVCESRAREIKRAKATQLAVLKEFAIETDDPELINHVERREIALKRLEEEARLLRRQKGGRDVG